VKLVFASETVADSINVSFIDSIIVSFIDSAPPRRAFSTPTLPVAMLLRRAISRPDCAAPEAWSVVYNSLVGRTYTISTAELCIRRTRKDGWVYISIVFAAHNLPICLPNVHTTIAYEVFFESFLEMHTFSIRSRALLAGAAPFSLVLRPYGRKEGSYLVDEGCEVYALTKLVQSYLPTTTNTEHEVHVSWPPRWSDPERSSAVKLCLR
jgi:hypothetical protein